MSVVDGLRHRLRVEPPASPSYRAVARYVAGWTGLLIPVWGPALLWALLVGRLAVVALLLGGALACGAALVSGVALGWGDRSRAGSGGALAAGSVLLTAWYAGVLDGTGGVSAFFAVLGTWCGLLAGGAGYRLSGGIEAGASPEEAAAE